MSAKFIWETDSPYSACLMAPSVAETGNAQQAATQLWAAYPENHDFSWKRFGGAKRDRTADLYNAIVALSQLSYSPIV